MELAAQFPRIPLALLDTPLDKSYLCICPFTLSREKSEDWEDEILSPARMLRSILCPDENTLDDFISTAI